MQNIFIKQWPLAIFLFGVMILLTLNFLAPKTTKSNDRAGELEERIKERSTEYQSEAAFAERGRIAQERMKQLHYANNIDRQELQRLNQDFPQGK